ncbi:Hpt domain-containing protein [Microvirga tunisiensis]|uniref:Hpt domain-containing protein n=2 Tax=Pannonibacter tanglangensis TaxID=2750084 RepID=A0ABW9ZI86_9HYPH|nr:MULTISPECIES: Hpt domain-containing protein [unclassified Pannonibacter]NBN63652.1 Hpt domain-containing protein [Pannonibacter sp. XCT-34]NBN77286.1 Hpt domain-containing protein [Pannonibacter sp. XCT-53]
MSGNDQSDEQDFGSDVEFVTPPKDLRKKVRVLSPREAARFDPVKAAEAALQRLSGHFDGWMDTEAAALWTAWEAIDRDGLSRETLDPLYQAAHNIKGQSQTLGYPLVGSVAGSLCHLIETVPALEQVPAVLLRQHVEAIRAMVSEKARDESNRLGVQLLERLREVTADYLRRAVDPDA